MLGTRCTLKTEDPSRSPARFDFTAPDAGFASKGPWDPKIRRALANKSETLYVAHRSMPGPRALPETEFARAPGPDMPGSRDPGLGFSRDTGVRYARRFEMAKGGCDKGPKLVSYGVSVGL